MLIKFNSGHDREAKNLYKLIKVPVPRPLRIPKSGEIRLLFSFQKAGFPPFTVVCSQRPCNYCSDTIVATRSCLCYFCNSSLFFNIILVVHAIATNVVVFFFRFSAKMAVSDVSQKYDVILRIFKFSKYQNISTLTV